MRSDMAQPCCGSRTSVRRIRRSGLPRPRWLTARPLELVHEAREGFNGSQCDSVVKRYAHPADGAVARRADEARLGSFYRELLLDIFVAPSDAKDHVHLRARRSFNRAPIEAIARLER